LGKVSISDGQTIDIPLIIDEGNHNILDGALWWPESAVSNGQEIHNCIYLYLVAPDGGVRASSTEDLSVFQRARVSEEITIGTWSLRISGVGVSGSKTVYWAAFGWTA